MELILLNFVYAMQLFLILEIIMCLLKSINYVQDGK